jgi:hypothetical protein
MSENKFKVSKFKYSIEFETIEQNVPEIVKVITKVLEENLAGSLTKTPLITFSTYEKDDLH